MLEDFKPTRDVLLDIKERIDLSERGHDLLERKRDGLIYEFREMLEEAKGIKANLANQYKKSQKNLDKARALEGDISLKSTAFTSGTKPVLKMETKNVMGLKVPEIEAEKVSKSIVERGYGIIGTTSRIDEAVNSYEKLVDTVIEAAEINAKMNRILDEIESTNRRVNALENNVIPRLKEARDFIEFRLEEEEREFLTRVKKVKEKIRT